jgi:hypothetical protein
MGATHWRETIPLSKAGAARHVTDEPLHHYTSDLTPGRRTRARDYANVHLPRWPTPAQEPRRAELDPIRNQRVKPHLG